MDNLTLILGGARSGKSSYAQRLAEQAGEGVVFVATATAGDDEMAARIAAHKASRPAGWRTLETPRGVGAAVLLAEQEQPADFVLVDCLTLLASNVLFSLPETVNAGEYQQALDEEVRDLLNACRVSTARWVVVSNEVGLGLVPEYPLARLYRDGLGRANQLLAQEAGTVLFMVAGLPLAVKGRIPE